MKKIDLFSIFVEYERIQSGSLIPSVAHALVAIVRVLASLVTGVKIFYYKGNSDTIIVCDKPYLLSKNLFNLSEGGAPNIVSKNRVKHLSDQELVIRSRVSIENIVNLFLYVKDSDLGATNKFSLISSMVRYVGDVNFRGDILNLLRGVNTVLCNDPASPFVRNFLNLSIENDCHIKLICETRLVEFSTEWLDFRDYEIYSPDNQRKDLEKYYGIKSSILTQDSLMRRDGYSNFSFEYRILFLQQYYHPLAFKSRFRHFCNNIKTAARPGVLTRLHPNERFPELYIFKIVHIVNIIRLSDNKTLEEDFERCKFSMSFSSTSLEQFFNSTHRPCKYIFGKQSRIVDNFVKN